MFNSIITFFFVFFSRISNLKNFFFFSFVSVLFCFFFIYFLAVLVFVAVAVVVLKNFAVNHKIR